MTSRRNMQIRTNLSYESRITLAINTVERRKATDIYDFLTELLLAIVAVCWRSFSGNGRRPLDMSVIIEEVFA